MTLIAFLRVLRKRWPTVVVGTVLGLALGALVSAILPRVYVAEARAFVTITAEDSQDGSAYQDSQFALDRVTSYTLLASSPDVLQAAIDELGLSISAAELSRRITVSNPPDTAVLNVQASAEDADQAAELANTVAEALASTIEEVETPDAGTSSLVSVSLTTPAVAPGAPTSPRWPLNLALGLLGGFALGVAWAIGREYLDTTIHSSSQVGELTGSTPLATVPFVASASERPLLALDASNTALESFRTLRSNLRFADIDNPPRRIVVTSAGAGEGKTTTAQNLAIALAQSGLRVCLVDADLRKPRITDNLGLDGTVGLTDVLAQEYSLEQVLLPWHRALLTVLPAGTSPSDPASLLGSQQMSALLDDLSGRYDFVILDTPPTLPVSDAGILAGMTDGALLVVRHGQTRKDHVLSAERALTAVGARVIGTVVTGVPVSRLARSTYGS